MQNNYPIIYICYSLIFQHMGKFYDYLYYSLYKYYSPKEKGATGSAASIVGGLQASNVLSIIMLPSVFMPDWDSINVTLFLIIIFFFQGLTYVIYVYKEKVKVDEYEKQWESKSEAEKTTYRVLRSLYIALSFGAFFGFAIYSGSRNQ